MTSFPESFAAFSSRRLRLRARTTRLLTAGLLAVGSATLMTGTAAAVAFDHEQAWSADPGTWQDPGAGLTGPGGADKSRPSGPPKTARGYDVSYPQCGASLPLNPSFAVVGINGGRVFSTNSCLASQISWGGGAAAELYANTGNPGPALSSFWPRGQTAPRLCDAANPDTADCAYDYGWNAAQQSFQTAQSAYTSLGLSANPAATRWWLDVETENSWRDDNLTFNVAALQGETDYLRSVGVSNIGFYSTTAQWTTITGGTRVFAPAPSWGAGSPSEKAARSLCASTTTSFTGGRLAMVQYVTQGLDADIRC